MASNISEQSKVSITLMGSVIGAAAWLTMVYAKGEQTSVRVDKVEARQEAFEDKMERKMDLVIELLQKEKK